MRSSARPSPRAMAMVATLLLLLPAKNSLTAAGDIESATMILATGMRSGSAAALRPILPAQGKIHLAMPQLDVPPGYYSAGQAESLLAALFRRHAVRGFQLGTPREISSRRLSVTAHLTVAADGGERGLELHFEFSHEDEGWLMREMREHSGA